MNIAGGDKIGEVTRGFKYSVGDRLETALGRHLVVKRRYLDVDALLLRYRLRSPKSGEWYTVDQEQIESWEKVEE